MDERDVEQGYANFHRGLLRILRSRDVKAFKRHVAAHPSQAGKLSHCLGLSDDLAEIEMHKAMLVRAPLADIHPEAMDWLKKREIEPPRPRTLPTRRSGSRRRGKRP